MKLVEISKKQLNKYSSAQKQAQFLQSFEWGEFQTGAKYFGIEKNGNIIFAFTMFEKSIVMRKKYYYAPRVDFSVLKDSELEFLFEELKKVAVENNVIFIRTEPVKDLRFLSDEQPAGKNLDLKFEKTLDLQASQTSILDIARERDEILNSFHSKTRYNIRLSARKGVKVRVGKEVDFEKFWDIMTETKDRDGFRLHFKDYYKRQLNLDFIELVVAEFEGEIIAANIVSYFGDMASYIHGSSSNKHRNVMAPFAIQWFSIKRAWEKGCKFYDFNGIDEEKWPGVTRFKRGFKGEEVSYPGCFDIVFEKGCYGRYRVMRKLRRILGRIINR